MVTTNRLLVKLFRKGWACMTLSEKQCQFCMKSQMILIARGQSITNQQLVDLLFLPLTRKHEIRGDAFSKSLSIDRNNSYSYKRFSPDLLTMMTHSIRMQKAAC